VIAGHLHLIGARTELVLVEPPFSELPHEGLATKPRRVARPRRFLEPPPPLCPGRHSLRALPGRDLRGLRQGRHSARHPECSMHLGIPHASNPAQAGMSVWIWSSSAACASRSRSRSQRPAGSGRTARTFQGHGTIAARCQR
jgi:hypothetical protein